MQSHYERKSDIRKACNHCIKAKAACDTNRPCLRCVAHNTGDSCASVARKHNVAKRMKFGESRLEFGTTNVQYNLSYSNSLSSGITHNDANSFQISPEEDEFQSVLQWLQADTTSNVSTTTTTPAPLYTPQVTQIPPTQNIQPLVQQYTPIPSLQSSHSSSPAHSPSSSPEISLGVLSPSNSPLIPTNSSPTQSPNNPSIQPTQYSPPTQFISHSPSQIPQSSSPSQALTLHSNSRSPSPSSPSRKSPPITLSPEPSPLNELSLKLSLPTLYITAFTKATREPVSAFSYVSNLLKYSPLGSKSSPPASPVAEIETDPIVPQNISIPSCTAASLVQTLTSLQQNASIDVNSPIHIDYNCKPIPLKAQPEALIDMKNRVLVDCTHEFGQLFGFDAEESIGQPCPVPDCMLPEGLAILRKNTNLFLSLQTSQLERFVVLLVRNQPTRIFLTRHNRVGLRHRMLTFLEEYPDFPLCYFHWWIKSILPNAVLPPCDRPYCHCKFPDDSTRILS